MNRRRISRREFLRMTALAGGAAMLPGCAGGEKPPQQALELLQSKEQAMALGPLRSEYVSVDGLRMHFLASTEAAGPEALPLVLVHGSGLSSQYMIPTARPLAQHFGVFVPDIPGYGDSGDPGRILDVPGMADWLDAWMAEMNLPRAAFLGNSFGCQVIADLAARYPSRVSHAVLQGPTTPPGERSGFWQFVRWRQNQAFNPGWLGEVTNDDYHKAGFLRLMRSFMFQISDRIEEKMPMIEAQVLVVRGEHDPIARQDFCARLVELAPRARLHIIPHVAHTLVVTAPDQLAQVTRQFIEEASA